MIIFLLSGCGTVRNRPPEWVENPKAVYPENEYLAAVGEGDTRRAAENAAAANLSRIFEAYIVSDERLLDTTHESGTSLVRTTDFTADINILSSQTLYNIQHAEAWTDNKGRCHAVAYLNRRETAAIYRDKIDELTGRVRFGLDHAGQAGNLLDRYAQLRTVNRNAEENELLLRQLKVIHPPSASASAPGYSITELQKALADTARQIRVQIRIDGDREGRLTACLEELITRYGFSVGTPAALEVAGRVTVTDTGQRNANLVFVRYELALQIKDTEGNVLAAVNEKGHEAHQSQTEARSRSFRTMERAISNEGVQRLDAFFDALTDQRR
ncbi:MAG TPA: LPP20 family lipoprotein [Pontiella sp.]|nr:LPP20 family lipoprotein [Pontiella sp.]